MGNFSPKPEEINVGLRFDGVGAFLRGSSLHSTQEYFATSELLSIKKNELIQDVTHVFSFTLIILRIYVV